jgi:syntaxin 16
MFLQRILKNLQIEEDAPSPQLEQQLQQQQLQQQQLQPRQITAADMRLQDAIIEERDRDLNEVAKDFIQINEMMHTMAALVDQQGEFVDSIRSNITKTDENVDDGKKNLEEAENHQKTETKLGLIVLAITTTLVAASGAVVAFFV